MHTRKRRSPIWKLEDDKFIELLNNSDSIREVLEFFGLKGVGGNHYTVKNRMQEMGLDYNEFVRNSLKKNCGKLKERRQAQKRPLEKIMVEHSTYSRGHLKKRLLHEGILKNKCVLCGLLPMWDKKPLVLVLDHINGVRDDHRLENLRLLCPNCNSQQPTFCGASKRKKAYNCKKCGRAITKHGKSGLCFFCIMKTKAIPVDISFQELLILLKEKTQLEVASMLGVSNTSIRKWVKKGYIPGSSNGKTDDFGSSDEGSIPSPGTIL